MGRSLKAAKAMGARFEQRTAEYLAWALDDSRVERRHLSGAKDRGDITGVMHEGERVVIECKATARDETPRWLREAQDEAWNDDALFWAVVRKRKGVGMESDEAMGRQLVLMTLEQYALLLNHGVPLGPDETEE